MEEEAFGVPSIAAEEDEAVGDNANQEQKAQELFQPRQPAAPLLQLLRAPAAHALCHPGSALHHFASRLLLLVLRWMAPSTTAEDTEGWNQALSDLKNEQQQQQQQQQQGGTPRMLHTPPDALRSLLCGTSLRKGWLQAHAIVASPLPFAVASASECILILRYTLSSTKARIASLATTDLDAFNSRAFDAVVDFEEHAALLVELVASRARLLLRQYLRHVDSADTADMIQFADAVLEADATLRSLHAAIIQALTPTDDTKLQALRTWAADVEYLEAALEQHVDRPRDAEEFEDEGGTNEDADGDGDRGVLPSISAQLETPGDAARGDDVLHLDEAIDADAGAPNEHGVVLSTVGVSASLLQRRNDIAVMSYDDLVDLRDGWLTEEQREHVSHFNNYTDGTRLELVRGVRDAGDATAKCLRRVMEAVLLADEGAHRVPPELLRIVAGYCA
jgi:hypothetical protein